MLGPGDRLPELALTDHDGRPWSPLDELEGDAEVRGIAIATYRGTW